MDGSSWKNCKMCDDFYCTVCKDKEISEGCSCEGKEHMCSHCSNFKTCERGNKVCEIAKIVTSREDDKKTKIE